MGSTDSPDIPLTSEASSEEATGEANSLKMPSAAKQLMLFGEDQTIAFSGVDDMNLVEILIGLPGQRRPPKDQTISVPWERGERSYYLEYSSDELLIEWDGRGRQPTDEPGAGNSFYLSVVAPASTGLPKQQADDVIVALMKLSARKGFKTKHIETTRYKLLSMMNWSHNGHYYNKLDEVLEQLVSLTVKTNALYDPKDGSRFHKSFHILESTELEADEKRAGGRIRIDWSQKLMQIFQMGFMKQLNTHFFYSLKNTNTKRIYRWLDKQLSFAPVMEVDVLRFAHKVLGYGVSYKYPSEIIRKLQPYFDQLYERGFCRTKVEPSQSDSGKKFVFTRITVYKSVIYPNREHVIEALRTRGVEQGAEELVDTYSWEPCLRQIEYHDFKGEDIKDSGAWLRSAIENDYELPKRLKKLIENAKEETSRWCDRMYEGLSQEEQEELQSEIGQSLSPEQREDDPARLRKRNQFLLERKREL